MAYQSLYRRYRPRRFSEIRGQDHLVKALRNAVREDRVGHAYLFSGPRGTGKTSSARILAKVLNCTDPQDGEPCCVCESCVAIEAGTSFDLHELDAASHNGVGDIRDLIEKAALGTPGRTKVYILDEVHMLSTAASNALLKTLEEPPDHVVFVLATTDPQKVLPTIRSRTQHFEVHLLPADELTDLVRSIASDAELDVSDEQVEYVVRKGAGSARDTLSALDQVVAAGGVPDDREALDQLVQALVDRDSGAVLAAVQAAISAGREPRVIGELLLGRLRDAFLAAMGADLGHLAEAEREVAATTGEQLGRGAITHALETLGDALIEMRQAPDPRIPLEVALVRVARPDADPSMAAMIDRVERLERAIADGGSPTGRDAIPPAAGPSAVSPAANAPPPTTAAPSRGRPADEARQALAERRPESAAEPPSGPSREPAPTADARPPRPTAGGKAALGAHRNKAATAPASGPEPDEPRGGVAVLVDTEADPFPTRDALTLAWGDDVLDGLPSKAKAFFKAGRFLRVVDGRAEFALPSQIHADKCEPHRSAVEQALESYFGRPVPLVLVVDTESAAPPDEAQSPTSTGREAVDDDEDIGPVDELRNADDVEDTHLQRITAAFPGAEVIGDDETP